MKMLVIPDVHLKPWMFEKADEIMQTGVADNAISLGDLPDDLKCKNNTELYNETFDAAEMFADKYPDSLWIIGNHEASYIWNEWQSKKAYHALKTAEERVVRFYHMLTYGSDKNRLAYAYHMDKVIFSHAGITDIWIGQLQRNHPNSEVDWGDVDQALDHINMLHKPDLWNMWSLLWARPQAEYRFGETGELYMADRYIQVVGHTPMKEITQEGEHGELISCDVFALDQKKKPFGSQEFLVIDTVTGDWESMK